MHARGNIDAGGEPGLSPRDAGTVDLVDEKAIEIKPQVVEARFRIHVPHEGDDPRSLDLDFESRFLVIAYVTALRRTAFIVGFPGETSAHFEHLKAFVQRHEFDHVGVFTFSPEDGTPAAMLPNPVAPDLMHQRREELMLTQQEISFRRNQAQIGKIVDVLIEQENPGQGECIGRSARFAPDVDGLVYVKGTPPLAHIVPVKITGADTYDLFGTVLSAQNTLPAQAPVSVSL